LGAFRALALNGRHLLRGSGGDGGYGGGSDVTAEFYNDLFCAIGEALWVSSDDVHRHFGCYLELLGFVILHVIFVNCLDEALTWGMSNILT
jgi:hypothetical protein